jgi:sulfate adenylyltransferase subunit 2
MGQMQELKKIIESKSNRALTIKDFARMLRGDESPASMKWANRRLRDEGLLPPLVGFSDVSDEDGRAANKSVLNHLVANSQKRRAPVFVGQLLSIKSLATIFLFYDGRRGCKWISLSRGKDDAEDFFKASEVLAKYIGREIVVIPSGEIVKHARSMSNLLGENNIYLGSSYRIKIALEIFPSTKKLIIRKKTSRDGARQTQTFSHLDYLEAEAIHIMREVVAEAENPVMLYSVGKDSSVMLHLAKKAFYPSAPPFPLMHIDTGWKFREMYEFRDQMAAASKMKLYIYKNKEGVDAGINPFDHGSEIYTDIMKTQALKKALDLYKFDIAFGGARRDEEKSRAKERIFSFRAQDHRWDPKNQRPELWNLYNTRKKLGQSLRVFPISNWTEMDVWQYIYREEIPIVPLYFSQVRPLVDRSGSLLMIDDDRMPLKQDEKVHAKRVRFRTLGCYPLTAAIESNASSVSEIILELLDGKSSERQGRLIDSDSSSSMEKKKQEGYF